MSNIDEALSTNTQISQKVILERSAESKEIELHYKKLLKSVTDYVYSVQMENGRVVRTYHHPACVNVTGYTSEEYESKPNLWFQMIHPADQSVVLELINQILSGEKRSFLEHRIIHKDRSIRWVRNTPILHTDEEGNVLGYDGTVIDITVERQKKEVLEKHSIALEQLVGERTRELKSANEKLQEQLLVQKKMEEERISLEDQLRQTQKMNAVGTLAGGIAHDFNNILATILGYTELLLSECDNKEHEEFLGYVHKAGTRGKNLVKQILTFSRPENKTLGPIKLSPVVEDVIKMIRSTFSSSIRIESSIPDIPLPILGDPNQIHQIIVNLCTNALHAINVEGGVLKIELQEIELRSNQLHPPGLKKGNYVMLSVEDNGCGMSPETLDRIFDPFFTTKEVDKGTGLGLSIVHGIVKNHNGSIVVKSKEGEGSTFQVYFPLLSVEAQALPTPVTQVSTGGSEHILVVDDEELIVKIYDKILTSNGYKVSLFNDSLEALKHFTESPDSYDLILTDSAMPHLRGEDLSRRIREIRQDIPIILISGYKDFLDEDLFDEIGINHHASKPIELNKLLTLIRTALDSTAEISPLN